MTKFEIEQWLDAISPSCQVRVQAIKRFRRSGIEEALRYLESLKLVKKDLIDKLREKVKS